MFSTRSVLDLLRAANPTSKVTEDLIRSAIRRGVVPSPTIFAGRFVWSPSEAARLALALGFAVPEFPQCPSSSPIGNSEDAGADQ